MDPWRKNQQLRDSKKPPQQAHQGEKAGLKRGSAVAHKPECSCTCSWLRPFFGKDTVMELGGSGNLMMPSKLIGSFVYKENIPSAINGG